MYLAISKNKPSSRKIIFNSFYAIFSTGFAAMGLEIILLFAFQNHYGCLYQKIGIIVALFMAGLAAGAQIMNQAMTRQTHNGQKILLAWEMAITAFSLFLPFLLNLVFQAKTSFAFSEVLFMVLVFGTGFLTGAEFPLVNDIVIKEGVAAGISAGKVNGYDHLGASLGGALTGTLFVPLLGFVQSCLFIAGLNFISCLFLAHFLFKRNA
jgi:spermidine synthase